jgi:GMP synthase (glutamine-hydrolysing)
VSSAVVVSHTEVAHELGHLEPWLDDHHFAISRAYREDRPTLPSADLLIVMGSPTSVASGFRGPACEWEIDAVAQWVAAGRPYLGLCFGAQVLAAALGGRVARQARPFVGYVQMDVAESAPRDIAGPWTLWHNDAITAPPGADVMGSLEHADLAFGIGRAWGLQPHIEVTRDSLERMAVALGAAPADYADLVSELGADAEESARRARRLLDAFLDWSPAESS